MAIRFRTVTIRFDPTRGRIQREPGTVVFRRPVRRAEAAIKGFTIGYTDGDHHVLRQEIDINRVRINGNAVSFEVDFLIRDSSGRIDDRFSGQVEVLVIADV